MDGDPSRWSFKEVQEFFQHHAATLLPDFAKDLHSSADQWCSTLKNDGILNGKYLMKYVDESYVKQQGFTKRVEIALRESLELLQGQVGNAPTKQEPQDEAPPEPPKKKRRIAPITVNRSPSTQKRHNATVALRPSPSTSDTMDIDFLSTPPPPQLPSFEPQARVDVNDIFYGDTAIGSEVAWPVEGDHRGATAFHVGEQLVSFVAARQLNSREFEVARRIQRGLRRSQVTQITRSDRPAAYISWYRPEKSAEPSATVVSFADSGEIIAQRENVFVSKEGITLSTADRIEGESWCSVSYTGPFSITDDDSEFGSSEAEEEDEANGLTRDEAQQTVDAAVEDMRTLWRDTKLPKLENQDALKVWRRSKQSRTVRDALVQANGESIRGLLGRLEILKTEVLKSAWNSKDELRANVGGLEATVEQILEREWQIEVWQRRQKPPGPQAVRQSAPTTRSTVGQTSSTTFVVHPDDRMSVSPEKAPTASTSSMPKTSDKVPIRPRSIEDHDMADFIAPDEPSSLPSIKRSITRTPRSVEPILIDSDMSSAAVHRQMFSMSSTPAAHKRRSSVKSKKQKPNDLSSADPFDMDAIQLKFVLTSDLIARDDRIRLLLKLIYDLGPVYRDTAHSALTDKGATHFWQAFFLHGAELASQSNNLDKTAHMTSTVCLFAAFHFCRESINCDDWSAEDISLCLGDRTSFFQFKALWQRALSLKDQRMFNPDKAPAKSTTFFLDLVSGDSDSPTEAVKHSKKKELSKASQESRAISKQKIQGARTRQQQASQLRSQEETYEEMIIDGDSQGRLIAINDDKQDTPVYINSHISRSIKPHQIDGVRFLWRELTDKEETGVCGGLLAHTMGLGKTMQAITTLLALTEASQSDDTAIRSQMPDYLLRKRGNERERLCIIVLCPSPLVLNWQTEIKQWDPRKLMGLVFALDPSVKSIARLTMLQEWSELGGILLISHELFRGLASQPEPDAPQPKEEDVALGKKISPEQRKEMRSLLLKTADIAVLDEAQAAKNKEAKFSKVANEIRARARIALTGTPLSNAINEIYELVSWISPDYLGDRSSFNENYANPIKAGLWANCTPGERQKMLKQLKVLIADIAPKVNRATTDAIKDELKPKTVFTLTIALTDLQMEAYRRMIVAIETLQTTEDVSSVKIMAWITIFSLLLTHPSAFRTKLLAPYEGAARKTKPKTKTAKAVSKALLRTAEQVDSEREQDTAATETDDEDKTSTFSLKTVKDILLGVGDDTDPALAAKSQLTLDIVRKSIELGDKVLVFSGRLLTLNYFEQLFKSQSISHGRMDGGVDRQDRMKRIDKLKSGEYSVLLISTRAGGVGLNIQSANRVVMIDSDFNPMNEEQAIGRAYRLGQPKPVFVYRIVVGGTFEDNLDNLQKIKVSMADRVVDRKNYVRSANTLEDWLVEPKQPAVKDIAGIVGSDPSVLDEILEEQQTAMQITGIKRSSFVYAIKTEKQAQVEAADEKLDDEEMQEVERDIEIRQATRRSARLAGRADRVIMDDDEL